MSRKVVLQRRWAAFELFKNQSTLKFTSAILNKISAFICSSIHRRQLYPAASHLSPFTIPASLKIFDCSLIASS